MSIVEAINSINTNWEDTGVLSDVDEFKSSVSDETARCQLNLLHLNIRSLQKHFDELSIFLNQFSNPEIDIIILSETFILSDINCFQIPGYNAFYNEADFNLHDGTVVYVKESVNASVNIQRLNEVTILRAIFQFNGVGHGLSGFYRLPSTGADTFIDDLTGYLADLDKQVMVIFVGDVNLDILAKDNKIVHKYLTIADSFGFLSYVNNPTRVTQTSSTCIDHFFARNILNKNKIKIKGYILENSITDHYTTLLNIKYLTKYLNINQEINIPRTKINVEKLNTLLTAESWNDVMVCRDSTSATYTFLNTFNTIVDQCKSEIRTRKLNKLKPWITNGIVISINNRDKMKKRLLKNTNTTEIEINNFKEYRNRLTKLIQKVKNEYYKEKLLTANNNLKHTWNIINEASGYRTNKVNKISVLKVEGKNEYDQHIIAEKFNNHFTSIGLDMAKNIKNSNCNNFTKQCNQPNSLLIPPINDNDIIILINKLKNNSAPGMDGITASIIKQIHVNIIIPLKHIFNLIISSSIIPQYFKTAVVTPIYKSGNKSEINNYRPISQINCFAKILEMYIKTCVMSFVEKYHLISNKQYGFQKGLSTESAINSFIGKVLEGFNTNKCTIATFLDLAKAFDTIPHDRLILKLEATGIRGAALAFFQNYLSNRIQYVRVNGVLSEPEIIKIGIPQGTVLGPILFLLYINDLYTINENCEMISYADDTVILYSAPNWSEAKQGAEQCLNSVKKWLNTNLLTLNINKTKFITFSITKGTQPQFQTLDLTDNAKIYKVENIKYLGIMIDQHLRWDAHAEYISQKLRKLIHIFYLLRNILHKSLLRMVYTALAESILRYGIVAWGSLLPKSLHKLQISQNILLKVMLGLDRRFSTDLLYANHDILNIRALYIHTLLCSIHKNRFKMISVSHNYTTRANVQSHLTRNIYTKSICQRQSNFDGPKYYNTLPASFKSIKNIKKFSTAVRRYVLQNASFY